MTAQTATAQRALLDGPIKYRPIVTKSWFEGGPKPDFDPARHLNYSPPSKIHTMKGFGFSEDTGISPRAISEGFPLFSREAIDIMRSEVFDYETWANCAWVGGNTSAIFIRGHCPKYAPFMHAALTHPETLKIVSDVAGVDLIPVLDFEVGSILIASTPESAVEGRQAKKKEDKSDGVITWHKDHFPFVCVVMLSDVSGMTGGETAIRLPDGRIDKIRGPSIGCATVMQGRYIDHQALPAEGGRERISMVTSFRPRDPMTVDNSGLKYITRIANPSELYYQWAEYRLEILQERMRLARQELKVRRQEGREFDVKKCKAFLEQQMAHVSVTNTEIVPIEEVLSGRVFNGREILGLALNGAEPQIPVAGNNSMGLM